MNGLKGKKWFTCEDHGVQEILSESVGDDGKKHITLSCGHGYSVGNLAYMTNRAEACLTILQKLMKEVS